LPTQVNRQVVAQVVAGRLRHGARLPSVRQFARDLRVSRTTAERIHETLSDTRLAEMRPRCGAFVALRDSADQKPDSHSLQDVYGFLKGVLSRAQGLGLDAERLVQLIVELQRDQMVATGHSIVSFPLIATLDWYECITRSVSDLPAQFVHVPSETDKFELPSGNKYLLAGYYMHERALKLSQALGCSLLFVRYNTKLLDRAMRIGPYENRWFVTRDSDNAESTRLFLASAYPDVSTSRYRVIPAEHFRRLPEVRNSAGEVWATITVAGSLKGVVPAPRLRVLHPLLAEDFVEELRCLALLG
jgi:GntR family transcriptional regulator